MYSVFQRMGTPYCDSNVLCPLHGKVLYKYYDDDEVWSRHSVEVKKCEIEKRLNPRPPPKQ